MFVNLIKIRPFGPFIITLKNRVSSLISDQGILAPGRHPISYQVILTAGMIFGKPPHPYFHGRRQCKVFKKPYDENMGVEAREKPDRVAELPPL